MDLINKSKHFSIKILMSQGLHMCNLWSVMYILQLAIHMHNQSIDRILNVLFFFSFFSTSNAQFERSAYLFVFVPFFFFHLHGKIWSLAWFSIEVNFAEVTGAFFLISPLFSVPSYLWLSFEGCLKDPVPERPTAYWLKCVAQCEHQRRGSSFLFTDEF